MDVRVLVPVAQGVEELEAVTIIDLLRRAGIDVTLAGENEIITCSRGLKMIPDVLLEYLNEFDRYDAIIIPGGLQGTENLINNEYLSSIIETYKTRGILFAAICAGPLVLNSNKVINKDNFITSHPSVKSQLTEYKYEQENVVVDGNIITSRGAGTAIEFTLNIISKLAGAEIADKVAEEIVFNYGF